ncbi:MAG TPA: 3-hydroxyacyl-CoA dehydrogenase NAD-binding domain-containing protein [Candidatus Limnocylindrales bacterium]|nr:3-hydroxyacyl-CoA dehydrogenase NAD-binding domain-containing protein [Candidatus Limnocylindrales bacterium]
MDRARVGIVGAGTMGAGIAQVALEGGWAVALHDPVAGAVDKARVRIRDGLTRRAAKVAPEAADGWVAERLARLGDARSLHELAATSQLVIEAALERLDLKHEIFTTLDDAADPGAILATNTSALAVSDIAEGTLHPDRIVGLHFFNPAPVLPLVEVVAGRRSADWAVERAAGIVETWGKTPIRVADVPGFIVNRVNRPFTLEPLRMLHAGMGSVESIDGALTAAGFPMGPFALMDLIGIDVNLAAARGLFEASGRPPRFRPSPIQEDLVAAGRLGRKTREGFYRYEAGRATGPAGRFAGTIRLGPSAPAPLDAATIAERVTLAIVNEAYRALGDRVATADDIDRAMRLGANHPFGPFEWANRTGVQELALMLDALADEDADTFRPSLPLLRAARSAT